MNVNLNAYVPKDSKHAKFMQILAEEGLHIVVSWTNAQNGIDFPFKFNTSDKAILSRDLC